MEHERRQRVTEGFNIVADAYDSPSLRGFVLSARRLVELAELAPGQRVLDVGTGTGNAALAAARAVGPDGQVVGVELAGNMRERALSKVAAAGLSNVEVQEGDAAALPFPASSFDAVVCASAIYNLPDIPAGLREWRRVLKPEGRLAFSSLTEGNAKLYYDLLRKYGIPLPPEMPLQRVDTPEKCAAFLRGTGFADIAVHTEQLGYYIPDADPCWDLVWNTGARIPLQYMPTEAVAQFRTEYLAAMAATASNEGIWIDWQGIFALGRKPLPSEA
jgi:ubiquinone/menaquinone biosynthesis C-methylase UbiE